MSLVGVGMPGHFLVGSADRSDIYVDAFSGGALMTREDCAARLRQLQPGVVFRPEFLDPVGPRQILTRMLSNLLDIYLRTERFPKALSALEMILCLQPDEPGWRGWPGRWLCEPRARTRACYRQRASRRVAAGAAPCGRQRDTGACPRR